MDLSVFVLTDKVAVITGAGRGVGQTIALGFAQVGADIVASARTAAEIEETADSVRAAGRWALAWVADMRDPDSVGKLRDKALDVFGRIDILVNNAGGGEFANSPKMNFSDWEAQLKENLGSVFLCSQVFGEVMAQQKSGIIINMGSIAGTGPFPPAAHYAAAKAGVINLTETLAVEWACYNIRVNAIVPGIIMTPLKCELSRGMSPYRQSQLKKTSLGRFGKPEGIVGTAIFLASEASSYITGQAITVSGGLTATVFKCE